MTKLSHLFLVIGLALAGCGGITAAPAEQSALTAGGGTPTETVSPIGEIAVGACAVDADTGLCASGGTNCGKTTSGAQCTCISYTQKCGCGIQNPGGTFTPCNLAK